MKRHAVIIGAVALAVVIATFAHFDTLKQREDRLVGYWIEHCVDQFRPKYQAHARRGCEEEAERWRYGTEEPFDWEGYEEAYAEMDRLRTQDGGVKEPDMKVVQ
jgi:hypothetical protein